MKLFIAAFVALLVTSAAAQAALELVPESSPDIPAGWTFEADIPYGEASAKQALDILHRNNGAEPAPLVIHIHAGGWYTGGKGGEKTRRMMIEFARAGYASASIGYRLADEATFPAAVEDCKLAVRWLRAHAGQYRLDPNRVAAMGASAGGHLSAMLAVTGPEDGFEGAGSYGRYASTVQAAVPVSAPFNLTVPLATAPVAGEDDPAVTQFLGGSLADHAEDALRASPLHYVRHGIPPMLIIHGTADKRVDISQANRMVAALEAAGAPHECIAVDGGKHGMDIARSNEVFGKVVAFLDTHVKSPAHETAVDRRETLQWWQDAKFGLFVHWGPASLRGQELSWSRGGDRPGMPNLPPGQIPRDEYDQLYTQFNPTEFNAGAWVELAHDAGMNYITFTTKHHDGFCMFDSALTDYSIAHTPYRRDIVAQLADACHRKGMGLGFYYSLPDWRHPAYKTNQHTNYIEYLHGQIGELLSNYGQVDLLWFDGKQQGTAETWGAPALMAEIRRLQPNILVNDRLHGDTDFTTPEQVIGRADVTHPWESCVTLGHQWSWKPDDQLKSWEECVLLLARTVGGGGNFILNVGPMPDGRIEPRQADRLRDIGRWVRAHERAIYATRGGPFPPSYWGASTRAGNTVFLHIVTGWESQLELPSIERTIVAAATLEGGAVHVEQSSHGVIVEVPVSSGRSPLTVVELTLDGPASELVAKPADLSIPAGATATASNVRRNEDGYQAVKAVDDDPLSRWATDDGVHEAWIEIHLPHEISFDVITMDEAFGPRVQAFRLLAKQDDSWKVFYEGAAMGRNWAGKFPAVTAQDLRLEITQASDGPTIRDIQFHQITR